MELSRLRALLPDDSVRAVTADDVTSLVELEVRATPAAPGVPGVTESEVRDALMPPHLDLTRDTFIAVGADGRATAFGLGYDERNGAAMVEVHLDPDLDAARYAAVADAAVTACLARVLESTKARGASDVHVAAKLHEGETRLREAYERAGLEVESTYLLMQVALSHDVPLDTPLVAVGVRLAKVEPRDDAILAVVHRLLRDTFSEHHGIGHEEQSFSDYAEFVRTAEKFDPESWWLAYDGDTAVGVLIGDDRRLGMGVGYIGRVGVLKQYRGRGIARALLLSAFADYRARGRTTVQLRVDGDNTTGATRLYESVGMRSISATLELGCAVAL